MQVVQDNFFYHSDSRLGTDGRLGRERQLLVEEQKLCRSRARKFSLETNRRRKALEDRRRQRDVHEQQLIENILKQRRQRVQEATERFQRAHLPLSQRRRQSFRRNVPNIEEALNQIQGSFSLYGQASSNSFISRSCTPSPRPPAVSKSSHRQALSAVEAYTKLLQEQSMTFLKNSLQTEKTPEKQHDHSPQGSQLSDCSNSESLSSKDSLENDELSHSSTNLQYSSFLSDSEKLHPNLREQKDLCPTPDRTSLSALMLLDDNLSQSRKGHEAHQKKQEDSEGLHVSKASWGITPSTETQPAPHNCNLLALCEIISADPEHFEENSSQNSPSDNTSVTNTDAPSHTALDPSNPKKEVHLEPKQNEVHDDRLLKHPSATDIILPAKNGKNKDILFWLSAKPNISLNDSPTDNGNVQQTGREKQNLSSQKESSINNLNKVSNSEATTEKSMNATSLQCACLSNIQSDTKCLTRPEEEAPNQPVSVRKPPSCGVRFIKGILKKQSKYMPGDSTCVYGSGHLIFAQQVALAIRDSVELTRAKTKEVEGNNGVKKKLRWFDEVQKEDKDQNTMRHMKGRSSNNNNSEDHQLSVTAVSGASKPGPGLTPPASTSYHFTKQAWADVGVQVSLAQERGDEVKVPRSSARTGGPKVPRRERSARAPVSSRSRKGTVIRPQSATEVSQIAKTQGRIMEPRPPPRMESEKTAHMVKAPYGADHTSVNCKQAAAEQAPHKDTSDGFFSPYTHNVIRTDSTVMYTPLPPSCTFPVAKGNLKGRPSSGHQETQSCSRRRGMVYVEKGLGLDSTPTEEEILQLWHGVRTALTTKDAKAALRKQALDGGRVARKPCVEPSRQTSGSGNRMLPQPTKQTTEATRQSNTYNTAVPDEGSRAGQFHLAEGQAGGPLEETDIAAAVETAQTQRSGRVQQRSQQQGLTTISLEEQKILLSLDRLNHQLFREYEARTDPLGWCDVQTEGAST